MSTTNNTDDTQEKYAEKIAALLRKAEDPAATPEEAEAFLAKATALMTKFAIDEQMIARAAGRQIQDELGSIVFTYTGIFQNALRSIGFAVARYLDCRAFFMEHKHTTPKRTEVHVFGWKSDLARAEMLHASIEIQATTALVAWRKTCDVSQETTAWIRANNRREFYRGFAVGLDQRLTDAKRAGREEAEAAEAARSNVSAASASDSVALVLRDRRSQVNDWFDETHGRGLRTVKRNYRAGSAAANSAGRAAGRSADIGQGRVSGPRGSIGKGGK